MTDLRERMEHLVDEVPAYVVPDARSAWVAGARRRLARRIGAGVAVVVLVALTAGLVGVLPRSSDVPPADGEQGSGVDGYPSRIEKPWFVRDLPERPGPLASVVDTGIAEWFAVSSDGEVWRVPQADPIDSFPPALSDDGRMLGYLSGHSTFVLRDLVTGEETDFPEVTDNAELRADEGRYWMTSQTPSFWSPDGTRLLVRGGAWARESKVSQFLLGVDGTLTEVAAPPGYAVGWLDDDHIGWLVNRRGSLGLETTDADGAVESRIPIDIDVRPRHLNQWSGALSPDHSRLAVVAAHQTGSLLTVSTSDGTVLSRQDVAAWDFCSPAWVGDEPAFVQVDGEASLDTTSGRRVIVADPALGATCVLPALDALGGDRHRAVGDLFGTTWLSWHWREVLLSVLGAVVLASAFVWFLRRRGRRLRRA